MHPSVKLREKFRSLWAQIKRMLTKSREKFFETVNIDFKSNPGRLWSVLKINSKTRSIPELVSMETGHQTSTNMTSQAGSSNSASVPSHKHRSKSSLLCASSSEAKYLRRFRKKLQKLTSNMEFTLHFTLEAGRLSSSDVHHMYRVRSPRYPCLPDKAGYRGLLLCL